MPRFPGTSAAILLLGLLGCAADAGDDTAAALRLDAEAKSHGGLVEACDGLDNNANGRVDETCGQCDFLVSRNKRFWMRSQCVVEGLATGTSLLPITVGTATYRTYPTLNTYLKRTSSSTGSLQLGQQIAVAKLNMAVFNTGDVLYVDDNGDGVVDNVSDLIWAAERAYASGDAASQAAFLTTLTALNDAGASVPLFFDATCVAPPEICDGVDNDGDGSVDESCGCTEVCDGIDNDDDGIVDDSVSTQTFHLDADGDGFGIADVGVVACAAPPGYARSSEDCNDTNPGVHPALPDTCNGVDDNCDGLVDEGSASIYFQDADGDGQGDSSVALSACSRPAGYTTTVGDCDDQDAAVHWGAEERCNGVDDNCDGGVDEGVTAIFFQDADGDGQGSSSTAMVACAQPSGYTSSVGDCDDTNPNVHDGAPEICNGIDDNCDAVVDDGGTFTFHPDGDGDGFGSTTTVTACSAPAGYVLNAADCDDADAAVHPGSAELCNGHDDNCVGGIDEGVTVTYYPDRDADGYGDYLTPTPACANPPGHVLNRRDCNDRDPTVHLDAVEIVGDGVDQNCNLSDLN